MKKLILFTSIFILLTACSNDSTSNCETVINANGPAFIKAVNNLSETVLVYFGEFNLPFGAELKSGVCEIYGVPAKNRAVEISTLDGLKSRDVFVDAKEGETSLITIGSDFY